MIQLIPQLRIYVAISHVDFRNGVDGLAAICRKQLQIEPNDGALFVFRNRAGTAIKMICYDGSGYWLIMKRFSTGKIKFWPKSSGEAVTPLAAKQLQIMIYNGLPDQAQMDEDWRKLPIKF